MSLTPTTLRPSSTLSSVGWLVVPSGSANAAMTDNNDSTYIHDNTTGSPSSGHAIYFGFTKPSIPANAALWKMVPRIRWQRTTQQDNTIRTQVQANFPVLAGYAGPIAYNQTTYNAWNTVTLPATPAALPTDTITPDKALTGLSLEVRSWGIGADPGQARVADIWLDVYFNEEPVASALAASSLTASSKPSFTWTFTDPEDDDQAGFRASVWLAADAADANCPKIGRSFIATDGTVRSAVACTGVDSNYDQLSSEQQWVPGKSFPNGALTMYLQPADSVNDRVRWSTQIASYNFTMAVPAPPINNITSVVWNAARVGYDITVTVPSWTHTPATTVNLHVQRQVLGGQWDDLPFLAVAGLGGQTAHTVTVCDPLVKSNEQVQYRVFAVHNDGTWDYRSGYSAATGFVSHALTDFYLRNPLDPAYTVLKLSVAGQLDFSSDEAVGVFWRTSAGQGQTITPAFISGGIQAASAALPLTIKGEVDWQTLRTLRAMQTVLFLQTDMDGVGWWVRLDQNVVESLMYSISRRSATTRPRQAKLTVWMARAAQRADGTVIASA
jgi:hypothetical protein